jgi:hypothetical protein
MKILRKADAIMDESEIDEATRKEREELEELINDLLYRAKDAREGSAEHRMIVRQLKGLRNGSQMGRWIFEELDMACSPLLPLELYS